MNESITTTWEALLTTEPWATYPLMTEEEALKALARDCERWGLEMDKFVLVRKES